MYSDKYGFKSLGCHCVTFFIGIIVEMLACCDGGGGGGGGGFLDSVTFGGFIVVVSLEVVVVLLKSLKLGSTIGFVIMVVVSIENVVGIVVTISLDSVSNSFENSVFSAFAMLPAVPAFGNDGGGGGACGCGGFLTRDISILTPPSTVPYIVQQQMMNKAAGTNRFDMFEYDFYFNSTPNVEKFFAIIIN